MAGGSFLGILLGAIRMCPLPYLLMGVVCLFPGHLLKSTSGARLPEEIPQSPSSPHSFKNEAIVRLSEVFGIDKLPIIRHHRAPPQYMMDLYHTVADSDGITRLRSPYGSDVVRGLPDRDTSHQMHFYFNVSYVDPSERILQAEFHLFKLRPKPRERGLNLPKNLHLIELRLYQVLDESRMYEDAGVRLLHHRRISAYAHGWEVFQVRDTVQSWVNYTRTNHGFLVTATALGGKIHVNGTYLRFAQRSEHHDSKQPVLVIFTENGRKNTTKYTAPSQSDILNDYSVSQQKDTISPLRQTYVKFLNEGYRAQHGPFRPNIRTLNSTSLRSLSTSIPSRSRRSKRSKRSKNLDYYQYPRKRTKTCARHELYVDFDEIGWSGWIISPKGYNAFHCKGECPFPLGQNQKPTNHATVQSIVHALRIGKNVGTPCCVPNKLFSISLLYFDDDENVILKQYDDMVAASCGCH